MIISLLPALAGCCTTRQCHAPTATETKYSLTPDSPGLEQALTFRTAGEQRDMLVLSGGGSHGAWGAGVLRGWRENTDNPRPRTFRIVTGVSTGALLATYTFLGETNDDELLESAYTHIQTTDIYRNKFLLFALFSDSFKSAAPLKRTIAKYIDTNTLNRVAAAAREGRQLYVGTANLDTGRLVIWDLTKIAADESNPRRLELYRNVVFASASIPIAVPPVDIDGNLYSDGGVRAQLFFQGHLTPAARKLASVGKSAGGHLRVHVIVNGQLGVQTNCVWDCLTDASFEKGIAPRVLEMMLDANANGDLYRIHDFCNAIADTTGHKTDFRWCSIPSDYPVLYSSYDFLPDQMKALYDAGREFGRTNSTWSATIPGP